MPSESEEYGSKRVVQGAKFWHTVLEGGVKVGDKNLNHDEKQKRSLARLRKFTGPLALVGWVLVTVGGYGFMFVPRLAMLLYIGVVVVVVYLVLGLRVRYLRRAVGEPDRADEF